MNKFSKDTQIQRARKHSKKSLAALANIQLRWKLLIMLAIPIIATIMFAQSEIRQSWSTVSEVKSLEQLAQFSVRSSALVHELQKERGASAGFLGSKGKKFITELPAQQKQTDQKITELKSFLDGFESAGFGQEFNTRLEEVMNMLAEIGDKRSAIISQKLKLKAALGYYTGMNGKYLELIGYLAKLSSIGELSNQGAAYVNFLQSKERAGIERAVLTNTFAKDQFGDGMYKKFSKLVNDQATYMKVFQSLANTEQKLYLEEKMSGPVIDEVARMRSVAFTGQQKTALTTQLQSSIGYGGLVHLFKNYVLRGQEKYIDRFNQLYKETNVTLDAYLDLAHLSDANKQYVETVRETVTAYKKGLDTALSMHAEGQNTAAIDATVKISDGPALEAIERLGKGNFGVDPAYWFKTITGKINLLKDVENKLSNDLTIKAGEISRASSATLTSVSILTLIGLVVTALFVAYFMRSILVQLGDDPVRIQKIAEEIANGNLKTNLDCGKRKPTGVFASMKNMQEQLSEVIEKDIQSLVDAARAGDLQGRISLEGKKGFFRDMSEGVNELVAVSEQVVNDTVRVFGAMAQGNLSETIETDYKGSFDKLKQDANATIKKLDEVINQDIQLIVDAAKQGNLEGRISLDDKSGFFESLAASINELVAVSEQVVNDTVRVFGAMAKGDLTETIETDYEGSFDRLKQDANATVEKLTDVITQIEDAADAVRSASSEISQGNTDLSQRTEEQASSLEETASSMEELMSTIKQTTDNTRHTNQLADGARDKAEEGGDVVKNAIEAMDGINEASKKISDIISVIDEIAFQTNLLALNAAVEAARAGEQGRGFAVVASEVRNLAQRSAAAAKEIKTLINDSVEKVEHGSGLVNKSGTALEDIVIAVKKVSDIIAEITAASEEQSAGITQVNTAVNQMDQMTQQNAALVEEAAAASESMNDQAHSLGQLMEFFNTEKKSDNRALLQQSEDPSLNDDNDMKKVS
jgi:methyl-accepting chemotaxis protein